MATFLPFAVAAKKNLTFDQTELRGTWRVTGYDTREILELPKNWQTQGLEEFSYLPVGQEIEFGILENKRIGGFSRPYGDNPVAVLYIKGPFNAPGQLCSNTAWRNVLQCPELRKEGVEFLVVIRPKKNFNDAYSKQTWKDVRRVGYEVTPISHWPNSFFDIWVINKDHLIIPLQITGRSTNTDSPYDFSTIGIILERVDP